VLRSTEILPAHFDLCVAGVMLPHPSHNPLCRVAVQIGGLPLPWASSNHRTHQAPHSTHKSKCAGRISVDRSTRATLVTYNVASELPALSPCPGRALGVPARGKCGQFARLLMRHEAWGCEGCGRRRPLHPPPATHTNRSAQAESQWSAAQGPLSSLTM